MVKTINNCFCHIDIIPQLRRPDSTPAATQSDDNDDDDNLPLSRLRDPTPAASQSDNDDDDDVPFTDLQDLLRQLPKDDNNPTMMAEEYFAIDDTLETGQALDDDDILCLVNLDDVPDVANDDYDDDAANDDDDDTQPTEVTTTQAREMITQHDPLLRAGDRADYIGRTAGECGLPRPTLGYGRLDTEAINHPQQTDDDR